MAKRSRSSRSPLPIDPSPESRSRSSTPESPSPAPMPSKIHFSNASSNPAIQEAMRCSLPPHRETLSFSSYEDYEVHYRQAHVNRCTECGRNFPTDRFLNLHIEENHDPLVAARRERGEKTYGCFVEDCERKCSTPQKRRMHLIGKHMFPKTYNFHIVNDGIDKQTSMLRSMNTHRRRLSSTPSSPREGRLRHRQTSISLPSSNELVSGPGPSQTAEPGSDEMEIAELAKSMSALRFVPASVTMNKGRLGNRS